MSIYPNVTEQDLDNLRKLADQQKEQRALKIKNRFLKKTHDKKLAESLSPITDKIEEVNKSINESTQELGDAIKKTQPAIENTPQTAIENTPQTAIENTPQPPNENNEGVIYDVEIENTLSKMTDNRGFFKTYHDPKHGWMINNHPIKILKGTKVEINKKKYNISPGIRNVLVDQSYDTAKSMTDNDKLILRDILQKTGYYNRNPTKGRLTGRDRYIKYELDKDFSRIMDSNTKLKGKGIEKIIIPSNKIDI